MDKPDWKEVKQYKGIAYHKSGGVARIFYMTEQGQEGKKAYLEKRKPDVRQYPCLPW